MTHQNLDVDYLIIGAGAAGIGFADVLVRETTATVALIDRNADPGGHWNDAYPFVRLHHPSHYYGVASVPLGDVSVQSSGLNAGLLHMATGAEIVSYYQRVLRETLLPTGRVHFLPMRDFAIDPAMAGGSVVGGGLATSRTSGQSCQIRATKRIVNATISGTNVPSRHQRPFAVAEGVRCIPLNDLVRIKQPPRGGYTVIGAGKTGMDACLWLLEQGIAPDAIRWIVSRDAWWIDRAGAQFTPDYFEASVTGIAAQMEALGQATTVPDLFQRLEACGALMRLDPTVTPTMFHGATVSRPELAALRGIADVVRLGRVTAITPDRLVLERGEIPAHAETLYVDSSAAGFAATRPVPVFQPGVINLQMLKSFQPTFSSALIAHLEAAYSDDGKRNELATPVAPPKHANDWLTMMATSMTNQNRWAHEPELMAWILSCRLDPMTKLMRSVRPGDDAHTALLLRCRQAMKPAVANLPKLLASLKAGLKAG